MSTPVLGMPELAVAQAIPETAVNEIARILEQGARWFVFLDRDLDTPPGSPADGDAYLVAASATGAWSGHDGEIAWRMSTAWEFITPTEGMAAYIADEDVAVVFDGSAWGTFGGGGGGGLSDGDYGDISVSGSGTALTIDNDAVTYAKMQNVSATSRLLGRVTSGAGDVEEIPLGVGLAFDSGNLVATGGGTGTVDAVTEYYDQPFRASIRPDDLRPQAGGRTPFVGAFAYLDRRIPEAHCDAHNQALAGGGKHYPLDDRHQQVAHWRVFVRYAGFDQRPNANAAIDLPDGNSGRQPGRRG